jgi:pimeloyl-ACP methyl ester carboxylesterase
MNGVHRHLTRHADNRPINPNGAFDMTDTSSTNAGTLDTATRYRSAIVDGIDVFYREAGPSDGPVLILLHGFPSSSRMFRGLIPRLADNYRLIAPDYPGFGHSAVPDRSQFAYTFDGLADITGKLLDQLDVDRFALYVMDFGAPVGFRLALAHPERLTGLVLQNAPLYPEAPEGWWATLGEYWHDDTPAKRETARAYLTPEAIKAQYLYGVTDPTLIDPDTWLVDTTLLQRPGVDEIMLDLLHDIKNNKPTFSAMQRLLIDRRPPVLVATGANDEIFPEPVQRALLDDLPDTEYHALNTGHFALEDHAAEVARLVSDFLDRARHVADATETT